ncbi:unnamed protein product [Cuscuta epithymum]|uniref:Uncharacterized protein n=1 Tax=Cuscuta epithymum TaxID=186058 RepID=A0AAV0CXK9_9ASTE|nr:unnamed protein product [Cuscuta epithymum]
MYNTSPLHPHSLSPFSHMNQIQRALLLCASIHRLHRIVHTPSSNSSQAITVVGSAAGRRVSDIWRRSCGGDGGAEIDTGSNFDKAVMVTKVATATMTMGWRQVGNIGEQ